MEGYEKMCAEVFLREQGKMFQEPVAETEEEALEFLQENFAAVFDEIAQIREYWEENGMDAADLSDEEVKGALEVFCLPNGKYLVVA